MRVWWFGRKRNALLELMELSTRLRQVDTLGHPIVAQWVDIARTAIDTAKDVLEQEIR